MFNLLSSSLGRRLLFAMLYFSEGAPIGFIWWAMPTRLRAAGVDVTDITWLTAVLVLPWTFKFLWAPLVDSIQTRRWTLKHWIVAAQTVMGLALLPLLWLNLRDHFTMVVGCLLVHAIAAATQDVAIDALCIRTTTSEERGRMNGWMQAGMLLGRAGLGGGALMMAAYIGEVGVVALLIAATWSSMGVLLLTKLPIDQMAAVAMTVRQSLRQMGDTALLAARQRNTWYALAFALTAGAAFEGIGVVAGPLMVDFGFTSKGIGYIYAFPIVAYMIGGSLLGGRMADRWGHRRATLFSLLWIVIAAWATATSIGSEAPMQSTELRSSLLMLAILAVYLGIGMFTASSYAMFMDVTSPEIAGTQFSAFMGATNGCESWSSFAMGRAEDSFGYARAIKIMIIPSVLALVFLMQIRPSKK